MIKAYGDLLDLNAGRAESRLDQNRVIRASYAHWSDERAVTKAVYHQEFTGNVLGQEWSTTSLPGAEQAPLRISTTPTGGRRYLGDFGSQAVHLNLRALPPHHEVAISFELFIISSWDGNDFRAGPDFWKLSIENGPTLLNTTFANTCDGRGAIYMPDELNKVKVQAYPDEYPGGHNGICSGADEVNTLGFMYNLNGSRVPMDAVYNLHYTFRSSENDLTLNFAASGLEPLDNESWGIAKLEVSVDAPPTVATVTSAVAPRKTVTAAKPRPSATRAAASRKPVSASHRVASNKHKPASHKSSSGKTTNSGPLHEKKKPLTP